MINFCLIGAGRMGAIHAQNVHLHPLGNLYCVADTDGQKAQKLANRYGAKVCDINSAVQDENIQAVIIASATNSHAEIVELVARAGKAILCEKPLDLSTERAKQSLKVVNEHNVLFAIGFHRRHDLHFQALKSALRQGKIGKIELLNITSRDPEPPTAEFLKNCGGLFHDMTIHDFDMARWLLEEEPTEVYVSANYQENSASRTANVATAVICLKTASGKLCNINNSRNAVYGYDQRVEVLGENGMLQISNEQISNLALSNTNGVCTTPNKYSFISRYQNAYRNELNNFINSFNANEKPLANQLDALQSLVLADAALASYISGQPIEVALPDKSY